ncbi:hypothetical protein GCM10027167_41260 [Nocardia heshunensis]
MNIERGTRLVPIHDNTVTASILVKAVRHQPISYAEIQPFGGGRRRVVSLNDLERDFLIVREGASVTPHVARPPRARVPEGIRSTGK